MGDDHATGAAPRLRVIYRSHAGENDKPRPGYYDKDVALASFARALENTEPRADVVFANDGPIPAQRQELMRGCGRLIDINGGSNRRSYRASIQFAAAQPWPDDDVIWFAEDDYLYQPLALRQLATRAQRTDFDLVALHGATPRDISASGRAPEPLDFSPARETAGTESPDWFPAISTTSTFGIRAGVLRHDRRRLLLLPYTGGAFDHTTCVTLQGLRPFRWRDLARDLVPNRRPQPPQWPRSAARAAVRVAGNAASIRRPEKRRILIACIPDLVHHMEADEAGHSGWTEIAEDSRGWAVQRDFPVPEASPTNGRSTVSNHQPDVPSV